MALPHWFVDFIPILILLTVIGFVLWRLPKTEIIHSKPFTRRRFLNWFPLGLTYAFLYMGRYNLTVAKNALPDDLITNADFGLIFGVGAITYGFAFVINGPITDRWGGRKTILLAATGSAVMNACLGLVTYAVLTDLWVPKGGLWWPFTILYTINMYFQSFGAVSIVKVNAAWFHVRERGVLGGVFGILIALGLYFAFDWGRMIVTHAPTWWVFFIPAMVLCLFVVLDFFAVFDQPSHAGFSDFDTADASSGDERQWTVVQVFYRMITNPVILTIAVIEFCSGFLRNAIMHWYPIFARQTGINSSFVPHNWGMLLCVAGICGSMVSGVISDHVFQSRRGPMAAVLYGTLTVGSLFALFLLTTPYFGWLVVVMSLAVIGVHGMLSGTATMDFGGKKNAGTATGMIDGMVYAGTALQSFTLGRLLPNQGVATQNPSEWWAWPVLMLPIAIIGFVLALRLWNKRPQKATEQLPKTTEEAELKIA